MTEFPFSLGPGETSIIGMVFIILLICLGNNQRSLMSGNIQSEKLSYIRTTHCTINLTYPFIMILNIQYAV